MSKDRIPFNYDKYAADPTAWKLYDGYDNQIVALFKSDDDEDNYVLKGIFEYKTSSHRKLYAERTWTVAGTYSKDSPDSESNICYMEPVEVKKPVAPTLKLHTPTKLRNLYYDRERNHLTMSMSTYSDYASAEKVAQTETTVRPDKEHLCVFSMTDHPQIREILIARGLAEVVLENG